jgi:4,5-DOPA dioxygenase extradiol
VSSLAPGASHVPPIFVSTPAPSLGAFPARDAELLTWARGLPRPRAVLAVAADWQAPVLTRGSTAPRPALREATDPAVAPPPTWRPPGAPELAYDLHQLVAAERDGARGWDAGVWRPLAAMFPAGDVPVLQLSLVHGATPRHLFAIGRRLGLLASRGVLVIGSGAITHNLEAIDARPDAPAAGWAREFDGWVANVLADAELDELLQWRKSAPNALLAQPDGNRLDPLFVVAGAASLYHHAVGFPVRGFDHGTVSRRCIQFGR